MGYSGRYHAASLAAIFLALAIGILIGVGLGHNIVTGARKDLEQSLKSDLSAARSKADTIQGELNQERDFSEQIYPMLVGRVLREDRIAVVALGALPEEIKGDIEAVASSDSPTGATLGEVAVVREPPDVHTLADATHRSARILARNPDLVSRSAARLGRALVGGAPARDRLGDALLSQVSGRPGGIDAVIVVRSQPASLNSAQSAATDAVESGLLEGLTRAPVPVVGTERSDADPSSVGVYDSAGLPATVDSIDLASGQVALAYALRGAAGDYGIKPTADRLLPALRRHLRTPVGPAGPP